MNQIVRIVTAPTADGGITRSWASDAALQQTRIDAAVRVQTRGPEGRFLAVPAGGNAEAGPNPRIVHRSAGRPGWRTMAEGDSGAIVVRQEST